MRQDWQNTLSAVYAWLCVIAIVVVIAGGSLQVQSALGMNIIGGAALYVVIYLLNVVCGSVGWALAGLTGQRTRWIEQLALLGFSTFCC